MITLLLSLARRLLIRPKLESMDAWWARTYGGTQERSVCVSLFFWVDVGWSDPPF